MAQIDLDIEDQAALPKKYTGDEGSAEQHPLKDLMDVERYERSKKAIKQKTRGLRYSKLVPPGAD